MSEILDIFKHIKIQREKNGYKTENYARIYFIDKNDVYYYSIEEDGVIPKIQSIEINNYHIRPKITVSSPVKINQNFQNNQELIWFCKNQINECQDYNIDLKDKFSYVIFDKEEIIFDNSMRNNKELVLSTIGCDYGELE